MILSIRTKVEEIHVLYIVSINYEINISEINWFLIVKERLRENIFIFILY